MLDQVAVVLGITLQLLVAQSLRDLHIILLQRVKYFMSVCVIEILSHSVEGFELALVVKLALLKRDILRIYTLVGFSEYVVLCFRLIETLFKIG